MEYVEPIVRADVAALENYTPVTDAPALTVPISVIYGIEDNELHPEGMAAWRSVSTLPLTLLPISGGHFSLFEQLPWLTASLHEKLVPIDATENFS